MKFTKKHIFSCILILIMFCAISQVSATDAVDNTTSTDSVEGIPVEESEIGLDNDVSSDVIANSGDKDVLGNVATFTELKNKIDSAGETLNLYEDYGYSSGDGDLRDGIVIDKDLTINGNHHTIYGNSARIFIVEEECIVTIGNLTFIGDYIDYENSYINGGAIYNAGSLTVTDSIFMNFTASSNGGAIYNYNKADLSVDYCEFYNNQVIDEDDHSGNGGAIASYGYLYITGSSFENCEADFGGAIATFKEAKIKSSKFGHLDAEEDGNTAHGTGGAIYNHCFNDGRSEPICYVLGCEFDNNYAGRGGGALFNVIAAGSEFGYGNYAEIDDDGDYCGHNMLLGMYYGYDDDEYYDTEDYYDTIMSAGFSFKPVSLIVDPKDNSFKVQITSTPYGEPVQGLDVYMIVDGGAYINTDLYVDEDNWVFNSTNSNGIVGFPLTGLATGDHTIEVGLWESNFGKPYQTFKVHLGLISSSVSGTNIIFNEGSSGYTVLTVTGATVTRPNVYVVGYPNANIQVGNNMIIVSNLPAGSYSLSVTTTPNYGYTSSSCIIPIHVNKVSKPSTPVIKKKTVKFTVKSEYGKKVKCSALFITPKINGKSIKGLTFKIQIYTKGKVVKTITIKSVKKIYGKKNTAFYSTNTVSKGTHKVKISISTSKYTGSKITSIVVKKHGTFVNKNGNMKGK